MASMSFPNVPRRMRRGNSKFFLLQQRKSISVCFARNLNQSMYQEYTEKMLRQSTYRQTLADRVSTQREKHREHIALQRRGLYHPSTERKKSYSLNSWRPMYRLSVPERQGLQLVQEMFKRANRHAKTAALYLTTIQSYALLRSLAGLVDFTLIHLISPVIQNVPAAFEALADRLIKWLEMAMPHIPSLGPGSPLVGWSWDALEMFYDHLQIEAGHGRIPEEWSKYRKILEKLALLVTPTTNIPPIAMFAFGDTIMEEVHENTTPHQYNEVEVPSDPVTYPISIDKLPGDSCSTAGSTVPSPTMSSIGLESSLEAPKLQDMAVSDVLSTPKVPEAVAAHGDSSQSSVAREPAAVTPIPSLPTVPEAVTEIEISSQSEEDKVALAQVAPVPLPDSTGDESAVRTQILNGTGRFDVNSISSIDDLVFILSHHRYNMIRIAKAKALREKMLGGTSINDADIDFLLRSCQYVLANADAPWFSKEKVLEKTQEWWQDKYTGMWRLKRQLVAEGGDDRPAAVKKLGAEIQNVFRVFYMPSGERKVAPIRKGVCGR